MPLKLVLPRPDPPGPGGGRWAGVGVFVAWTGGELVTGVAAGVVGAGTPPGGLTNDHGCMNSQSSTAIKLVHSDHAFFLREFLQEIVDAGWIRFVPSKIYSLLFKNKGCEPSR